MPKMIMVAALLASTALPPSVPAVAGPAVAGPAVAVPAVAGPAVAGPAVAVPAAAVPAAAGATSAPPSGRVTIDRVKANGTGCRANDTTVAVSPDKEAFTVLYSAYLAQAGAGIKNNADHSKCGITVRLNVPENMTYAVSAVDYRGFAHLEAGASATLSARYRFQSSGERALTDHTFAGALVDDWQVTDVIGSGAEFSKCKEKSKIDIDTELRVQAPAPNSPTSFINMDSTDAEVSSTYHLIYRTC